MTSVSLLYGNSGNICKILILVIFSGSKKSAVVSMMQVAVHVIPTFLIAPVVNRREIKGLLES